MAANATEAQVMVDAAKRADRILMEAFHWRYHPMAARIRQICDEELGTIRRVDATFTIGHLVPPDIRFDLSVGGGSLMDLGVYPLQWIRWVMQSEPQVEAAVAVVGEGLDPEIDLEMDADLSFPSGAMAHLRCSMQHGSPFVATLAVQGSDGTLHVTNPLAPQLGNQITVTAAAGTRTEQVERTATYEHQLRALVAAVQSGVAPPTGGTDSVSTMEAVDAIYRAAGLHERPSRVR